MAFFHECIAYIVSKPKNQATTDRIKPASAFQAHRFVDDGTFMLA